MKKTSNILILFFIGAVILFLSCDRDKVDESVDMNIPLPQLTKVFEDDELSTSYKLATTYDANYNLNGVNYFGIYPMTAIGNTLYLGLGGLPAGENGAAIAKYNMNDTSLNYLRSINEQGIMALTSYKTGIAVPGADPCCGDLLNDEGNPGNYNHQWDWGNFYYMEVKDQIVIKRRNLPNTIHGWGSWYDFENNTLYYAGSGHLADGEKIADATTTGLLFKTTDSGRTWIKVADRNDGIGLYRSYDIIGIGNTLYIQYNDELSGICGIAKSTDEGLTWLRLPNVEVACATRLYNIENQLVALSSDAKSFVKIDGSDTFSTHSFDANFQISGYHTLSHDTLGNAYVGTTDGRVMHTLDFDEWTEIARLSDSTIVFSTSTYWEEKQSLVLGNWGDSANLWRIPLSNSDNHGLPDILE